MFLQNGIFGRLRFKDVVLRLGSRGGAENLAQDGVRGVASTWGLRPRLVCVATSGLGLRWGGSEVFRLGLSSIELLSPCLKVGTCGTRQSSSVGLAKSFSYSPVEKESHRDHGCENEKGFDWLKFARGYLSETSLDTEDEEGTSQQYRHNSVFTRNAVSGPLFQVPKPKTGDGTVCCKGQS